MRSATFTLLAAALASVCSPAIAADCPTVPVASPLPAKFSLNFVPLKNGPLPAAGGPLVAEENYDLILSTSQTGLGDKKVVIFQSNSTYGYSSAFVDRRKTFNGPEWRADWFVSVGRHNAGRTVILSFADELAFPVLSTGFGVVNGSLTLDAGKGPQSLWGLCFDDRDYILSWGNTAAACVPVNLKVNVL